MTASQHSNSITNDNNNHQQSQQQDEEEPLVVVVPTEDPSHDNDGQVDERTYLDLFAEVAKDYLTHHMIPPTSAQCQWDWQVVRCEPYCTCEFRFEWGDYHLGRSCRERLVDKCGAPPNFNAMHFEDDDDDDEEEEEIPAAKEILIHTVRALQVTRDHLQKWTIQLKNKTQERYQTIQENVCDELAAKTDENPQDADSEACIPSTDLNWKERILCRNFDHVCETDQKLFAPPDKAKEWMHTIKTKLKLNPDEMMDKKEMPELLERMEQNVPTSAPKVAATSTSRFRDFFPDWSANVVGHEWSDGVKIPLPPAERENVDEENINGNSHGHEDNPPTRQRQRQRRPPPRRRPKVSSPTHNHKPNGFAHMIPIPTTTTPTITTTPSSPSKDITTDDTTEEKEEASNNLPHDVTTIMDVVDDHDDDHDDDEDSITNQQHYVAENDTRSSEAPPNMEAVEHEEEEEEEEKPALHYHPNDNSPHNRNENALNIMDDQQHIPLMAEMNEDDERDHIPVEKVVTGITEDAIMDEGTGHGDENDERINVEAQ